MLVLKPNISEMGITIGFQSVFAHRRSASATSEPETACGRNSRGRLMLSSMRSLEGINYLPIQ